MNTVRLVRGWLGTTKINKLSQSISSQNKPLQLGRLDGRTLVELV